MIAIVSIIIVFVIRPISSIAF